MGDALAARMADQPLLSGQAVRILTDEKLAAMSSAGSDEAFATLYRRYHQSIYRYCLSFLRQEADARDALQSSMLAALSSLRARPIEGAFKPWLFRIAHNQSISIIRRRAREAPTDAPAPAAVSDDPETREQLRTLVSDLSALPDRQRGAIVMRELSGLSYMEIGAALGTSQAAGKQLVYEARLALQDLRAGHEMSCELVRERISARDRRLLRGRKIRSHLRGCQPCQDFERAIRPRRNAFALLAPPLSPLVAATVFQEVLGAGAATGGTGGAAGAVGATGMASGGIPAAAGPVLLKVAAAVLVAGAAGVGAYEAGRSILAGDSGSMPAAAASAAQAGRHDGPADTGHAARPTSAREGAGDARARGADQDKGPTGASDSAAGDEGATPQVDDQASPGTHGAPDSAATGGSDPTNPGGSDALGTAAPGPTETAAPGPTETATPGPTEIAPQGGGSGGGTDGPQPPAPPTSPPPEAAPPSGGQVPPGTPPGHGGVPPGQGGVPPGQAGGGTPPGLINNPGHG